MRMISRDGHSTVTKPAIRRIGCPSHTIAVQTAFGLPRKPGSARGFGLRRAPHPAYSAFLNLWGFSVDVQFGNEQRGIQSATALKAVLTEAAGHQALVFLAGDGGTLVVGVGHSTHAVLLYNPKAGGPPLHGVGDSTADSSAELQPPLTFDGRSFFDRCALPAQQARRAAQFFFESGGGLLDSIVWEPEQLTTAEPASLA